jgi:4-hydroxy-3-methylbut-2-en-1-yl diphosphate reductase
MFLKSPPNNHDGGVGVEAARGRQMEVVRAETAGFCMGEVLALQKLASLVEIGSQKHRIYTIGSLVHHAKFMAEHGRIGVFAAASPEEIPAGSTAVIGVHGVSRELQEDLVWRGVSIVDATCPKVRKAQLLIEQQTLAGRMLLLYGEEGHVDVTGLVSYARAGAFTFDAREKLGSFPLEKGRQYCLAAQATQEQDAFDAIAGELNRRHQHGITVLHTICDSTRQQQEEAVRIAKGVELMVVVGGLDSGNTQRLAQVVASQNTPVLRVETAGDLSLQEIRRYSRIGLTAGTATPGNAIDEVHALLASP